MSRTFDTLVIGGGPAGSTTAGLLAAAGLTVLVIEKGSFPRFHIGESLLPRSLPIMRKMGIDESGPAFRYKGGAEFLDEAAGDHAVYRFQDALPGVPPHAFQVDRALFDAALLERASKMGATVHQGERVSSVDIDAARARVVTSQGEYTARFCVDATGQDAFFARRDRTTMPIEHFGRGAVFTHYEDISDDALEFIGDAGNIKVLMRDGGWGWLIPLSGRRLSVGAVTRLGSSTPDLLEDAIVKSPTTRRLIEGARRLETRIIRNFSYRNTRPYGVRYSSVGDAACFLDPVFSSGVALAMLGAEALSAALVRAFAEGHEGRADLMAPVFEHMERAYEAMSALIYAFYQTTVLRSLFFVPRPDPELRSGLISLLALDVWRTDNKFQDMLLRSRRRQSWPADQK